jgi:hypothetical protein
LPFAGKYVSIILQTARQVSWLRCLGSGSSTAGAFYLSLLFAISAITINVVIPTTAPAINPRANSGMYISASLSCFSPDFFLYCYQKGEKT